MKRVTVKCWPSKRLRKSAVYAALIRGLSSGSQGVRLVISDNHESIKADLSRELLGAEWLRCIVHFQRNTLAYVLAKAMSGLAEDLSAIFKVRKEKTARALTEEFVSLYEKRYLKAISVFEAGIEQALTYLCDPGNHHPKIRSTNMLERLFKEVEWRTKVVGSFPNETSTSALVTKIMLRSSEEWVLRRYLTMDTLEAAETHNIRDIDVNFAIL